MKRSEAVKLIADYIYASPLCEIERSTVGDPDYYANDILTKLEEAGMLPPPIYKCFHHNKPTEYEHKWEAE